MARGLEYSHIQRDRFSELENEAVVDVKGKKVNGPGLIHGVYLRDHSSHNAVRHNQFDDITGAPIKRTGLGSGAPAR